MFEKSGNVYRTQNVPKLLCRVKWFGHGNGDSGHIYIYMPSRLYRFANSA